MIPRNLKAKAVPPIHARWTIRHGSSAHAQIAPTRLYAAHAAQPAVALPVNSASGAPSSSVIEAVFRSPRESSARPGSGAVGEGVDEGEPAWVRDGQVVGVSA